MQTEEAANVKVFDASALDQTFEKKTQFEYESAVKQKKIEINNLSKQQLKPSVRVAFLQLAEIHQKFGYLNEALFMMRKAYNDSHDPIDQYNVSYSMALLSY